jgi:hypothetical protein
MRTMVSASAFSLLLCAAISGCATQAQQKFQTMTAENKQNVAQFNECNAAAYNSPQFSILRPHLPAKTSDITLGQLADTSFATPEEAQAILAVHPKFQECRKSLVANLAQAEPSLVPILVASFNKRDDDLLALIQRKTSWGDFVRKIRDGAAETQAALAAEDQRVVGGLQEENEAELAQRQHAAEVLATWAQTQEMINALSHPAPQATIYAAPQTSPSINCLSTPVGSMVQTNCH